MIYAVQIGEVLWVIHAFKKKSKAGTQTPKAEADLIGEATEAPEGSLAMTNDDELELAHGRGKVFRDFGHANADAEQLKAILAAKIIGVLDEQPITVRRAHELTGSAASDFSRVRQAKLARFTIDRLMAMLGKLGQDDEVSVTTHPRKELQAREAQRVARLLAIQIEEPLARE